MLSSLPGVAMKAKVIGTVIGTALEDFDEARMYSDTYVNQFGDDMVDPVYAHVFTNSDPRIHDGCYYSGGVASGDEPCVPLVSTTTDSQLEEVNDIIETETVEEALNELRETDSDTENLADGTSVKVGQIIMFVRLSHRWADESQLASLGVLVGTSSLDKIGDNENETMLDRLVALANSFVDGVLSIFEIKVNRIEVADELCVDGVCINADNLRTILNLQGGEVSSSGTSTEPVYAEPEEETQTDPSEEPGDDTSEVTYPGETSTSTETDTSTSTQDIVEESNATSTSTDDVVVKEAVETTEVVTENEIAEPEQVVDGVGEEVLSEEEVVEPVVEETTPTPAPEITPEPVQ